MNSAPEGLNYCNDNDKFAHADAFAQQLEKGKFETGRSPNPEHEAALTKRMLDGGSHDPVYNK